MAYILTAFDKDHRLVMEHTETSKGAALIGFDIWCDGSLDETGRMDYVDLLDTETGEVLLSGKVVR